MPRLSLVALPLLVGCGGTMTIEGLDAFGTMWSAMWIHYDSGSFEYDALELTNLSDGCEKLTAYYDAAEAAIEATDGLPSEGWCIAAHGPYEAWAKAGDALVHDGAHYVDLSLFHGAETAPVEATFGVDNSAHLLSGVVTYMESSPYETFLADWDTSASYEESCGIDEASLEGRADVVNLSAGSLELANVEDEAFAAGRLDGELSGSNRELVGTIEATFRATWCEVDVSF
ncbi:MAG: hypothetical protein Q8P41_22775 [Pseudomonadota bacterium]|nr:hypothetical protein [Pseudomonadota bacterium]